MHRRQTPHVEAIALDVGETLVDERRYWRELARRAGVPEHVLWAALGATIAAGEDHRLVWQHLDVTPPPVDGLGYGPDDLFPDAPQAIADLRAVGLFVAIAGNQPAEMTGWGFLDELEVDLVTTSADLGAESRRADSSMPSWPDSSVRQRRSRMSGIASTTTSCPPGLRA